MPTPTPEFLAWSLAHGCPLRQGVPDDEPEKVERHLRTARAFSDARAEGRIFAGICLQDDMGFRATESLALYGGLDAITAACHNCPANGLESITPATLAGCFGLWPLPLDARAFHALMERAMDERDLTAEVARHFPLASPHWYGLWQHSPLTAEQLAPLAELLSAIQASGIASTDVECQRGLAELQLAIQAAQRHHLALHVRHYPRGEVTGPWWQLVPHCPTCHAEWQPRADRCFACSYLGPPAPAKKRHARGPRPYFPLARLLGESQATALLAQYRAR